MGLLRVKPGAIVAAWILMAALVAATGANAGTSSHQKVTTIAIATPAKANDYGWNQQGIAGAKAAAKAEGATATVVQNIGYDNTESVLRQLASKKPGLLRLVTQQGVTLQVVAGALTIYVLTGLIFAWVVSLVADVSGVTVMPASVEWYALPLATTSSRKFSRPSRRLYSWLVRSTLCPTLPMW